MALDHNLNTNREHHRAHVTQPELHPTEIVGTVESAVDEDGEFTNGWAVTPD